MPGCRKFLSIPRDFLFRSIAFPACAAIAALAPSVCSASMDFDDPENLIQPVFIPPAGKPRDKLLFESEFKNLEISAGDTERLVGTSWSTVLHGTAQFIAARAEQEIIVWFVDGTVQKLCANDARLKNAGKNVYFPKTCEIKDIYSASVTPTTAHITRSFQDDLERLPAVLMVESSVYRKYGFLLEGRQTLEILKEEIRDKTIEQLTAICEKRIETAECKPRANETGKEFAKRIQGKFEALVKQKRENSKTELVGLLNQFRKEELADICELFGLEQGSCTAHEIRNYAQSMNAEAIEKHLPVVARIKEESAFKWAVLITGAFRETRSGMPFDNVLAGVYKKYVGSFAPGGDCESAGLSGPEGLNRLTCYIGAFFYAYQCATSDSTCISYVTADKLRSKIDRSAALTANLKARIGNLNSLARKIDQAKAEGKRAVALQYARSYSDSLVSAISFINAEFILEYDSSGDFRKQSERFMLLLDVAHNLTAGNHQNALYQLGILFKGLKDQYCAGITERCPATGYEPARQVAEYAPFLVELTGAGSPEEVEQLLGRVASPLGAWRLKQTRDMLSLTAMPGLSLGREKVDAAGVGGIEGTAAGLFAPVGFEYTWSNGFGVHLSVIDLGNLLNKRTSGNEEDGVRVESNDTEFSDVLSLGIYGRYKFPNSPFIVGLGGSQTPDARTLTLPDGSQKEAGSTRLLIFLSVDVTLFAF